MPASQLPCSGQVSTVRGPVAGQVADASELPGSGSSGPVSKGPWSIAGEVIEELHPVARLVPEWPGAVAEEFALGWDPGDSKPGSNIMMG